MRKIDGLLNEHKKKVLKRLSLSPALQVLGGLGGACMGPDQVWRLGFGVWFFEYLPWKEGHCKGLLSWAWLGDER